MLHAEGFAVRAEHYLLIFLPLEADPNLNTFKNDSEFVSAVERGREEEATHTLTHLASFWRISLKISSDTSTRSCCREESAAKRNGVRAPSAISNPLELKILLGSFPTLLAHEKFRGLSGGGGRLLCLQRFCSSNHSAATFAFVEKDDGGFELRSRERSLVRLQRARYDGDRRSWKRSRSWCVLVSPK